MNTSVIQMYGQHLKKQGRRPRTVYEHFMFKLGVYKIPKTARLAIVEMTKTSLENVGEMDGINEYFGFEQLNWDAPASDYPSSLYQAFFPHFKETAKYYLTVHRAPARVDRCLYLLNK